MRQAEIRRDEEEKAVSPVIATILMVAITVVLAGVLYVWANNLASEGTDTSVGTLNTYTTEDAEDETGPGAEDTLVKMQMTGKDDLAWSFIKITLSVGDNVYTCSVVAGDDCQISQAAGDNDNAWEPGEYLFLSEGDEDICSEAECLLQISVTHNGRTVAGDGVSGQGGNVGSGSIGGTTTTSPSVKWISVGQGGTILTSSDGSSWTSQTSGTTQKLNGVASHDGLFVVVGSGGTILTSTDGVNWDTQSSGTTLELKDVKYIDSQFWIVGRDSVILTSTDGTSWSSNSNPGSGNCCYKISYGDGMYHLGGRWSYHSTDGSTWTKENSQSSNWGYYGLTFGNNFFVGVSNGGIWTFDGTDEVQRKSRDTNAQFVGVDYGNNLFISVGEKGVIYTSSTGATWSEETSGITTDLNAVDFGDNQHIAVGSGGNIVASTDGSTWTSITSGTTNSLWAVTSV